MTKLDRRAIWWSLFLAVGLVILAAVSAGVAAVNSVSALVGARESLLLTQKSLADLDVMGARVSILRAQTELAAAKNAVTSPGWVVLRSLPVVGQPFRGYEDVLGALEQVVVAGAKPTVSALESLLSDQMLVDSQVNLGLLEQVAIDLDLSSQQLSAAVTSLGNVSFGIVNGLVMPQVKQLARELDEQAARLSQTSSAVFVAADVLGAAGPREWLIAVQNPAETRGTGGILGAYGVMKANNGKISLEQFASNDNLVNPGSLLVDIGEDFIGLYGQDPAIWINSNMSPNFAYGARIWLANFKQQFGQDLDGVISIEPIALSYLMAIAGPITLSNGEVVSAENLPVETMSNAYVRFGEDQEARGDFLADIAKGAADAILSGQYAKTELAVALRKALAETRVAAFSNRGSEQQFLEKNGLSGAPLTTQPDTTFVTLNNLGANKLDYYLGVDAAMEMGSCDATGQSAELVIRLRNSLEEGYQLPLYVNQRADKFWPPQPFKNWNKTLVGVYAPIGATIADFETPKDFAEDSVAVFGQELGRDVVLIPIEVPSGGDPIELRVQLDGLRISKPSLWVTPLVWGATQNITGSVCL